MLYASLKLNLLVVVFFITLVLEYELTTEIKLGKSDNDSKVFFLNVLSTL